MAQNNDPNATPDESTSDEPDSTAPSDEPTSTPTDATAETPSETQPGDAPVDGETDRTTRETVLVPDGDVVETVQTVDPETGLPVTYIVVEPRIKKRGRRVLAWACVVLVWLLFLPSVVSTWADRTFLDTGAFIAEVRDVVERDDVQRAIVNRVTDEIMALPAIQDAIADYLPKELQNFETLVVNAVRTGVQRLLTFLIESNFAQGLIDKATDQTLRRLHAQLMAGEDLTVSLTDLIGLFNFDPSSLVGGALARVPDNFGRVTLLEKSEYPAIYTGVDLAQHVWVWLTTALILLAIAAIAVAVQRRRMLMILAFGIAIVALVLNGVIRIGTNIGFSAVASDVQQVAREVGNTLLSGLYRSLWLWTIFGLAVGLIALLWPRIMKATSAASNRAKEFAAKAKSDAPELADKAGSGIERAWASTKGFVDGLGLGERADSLGTKIAENPIGFRWAVIIACALGFLIWPAHSFGSLLFFGVLGVAAIGGVEFLLSQQRSPEARPAPAGPVAEGPAVSETDEARFAALERISDLYQREILTKAEFDAEKKRILSAPV